MTSYVLTLNEENLAVKSLLNVLKYFSKTDANVRIVRQKASSRKKSVRLTEEELELVEKSLNSGICEDMSSLRKYIKSQI